jgi:hypothetical protein
MAACDPIYFNGISAEIFQQVKQELVSNGFTLTGSSGTVQGPYGIVIRYNWNEPTQVLEIDIVEKSFFITCNQIKTQLYKAFNKYVSSH